MPPSTTTTKKDRIAAAREKAQRAAARLRELESAESEKQRKLETRCKILLGGSIMAHLDIHPEFHQQVDAILGHVVKKPADYELLQKFGFMKNLPAPKGAGTDGA